MRFTAHNQPAHMLVVTAGKCFGGHSGGETPGPIPNPEAKPSSADGTAPGRVWESRTPPNSNHSKWPPRQPGWAISVSAYQSRVCAAERISSISLADSD